MYIRPSWFGAEVSHEKISFKGVHHKLVYAYRMQKSNIGFYTYGEHNFNFGINRNF